MDLNTTGIFATSFGQIILEFYNSTFFLIIKFFLGIYAAVVLADIVLLLIQRGLSGDIRDTLIGMNVPPELTTRRGGLRKKWDKIRKHVEKGEQIGYKIAIIKADDIIDDLIKRMKYPGENMAERLSGINPGQIENIEELKIAHEIRNQIVQKEDFPLSKEKAEEVLGYYENFLRYFQVLD